MVTNQATYLLRKREIMMKADEMFNECNARYRGLNGWLDDSWGQVRALDLDSPFRGYQWRPERSRACEYVAAFERIGRHATQAARVEGAFGII
jgi:hypothetical protein